MANKVKIGIVSSLIIACIGLLGYCIFAVLHGSSSDVIEIMADMAECNFDELQEDSQVIALVEISDEFKKENSNLTYDSYGDLMDFYTTRTAKVLELYKDERNIKDSLEFIEPAAVDEDGSMVTIEDYRPLKKGLKCILYLSDSTKIHKLSLMGTSDSFVNIENPSSNPNDEIAFKTLVKYGMDLSRKEKEILLNSEPQIQKKKIRGSEKKDICLAGKNIELEYKIGKDGSVKGYMK